MYDLHTNLVNPMADEKNYTPTKYTSSCTRITYKRKLE